MSGWEYKVVPAPKKGAKGAGVKGAEGRFANAIEALMNDMGAQGWEYQRAETLPSTERSGLTGSTTEWRNLLVFRRTVEDPIDAFEPELLPAPTAVPSIVTPSVAVVAAQSAAPAAARPEPPVTRGADQSAHMRDDAAGALETPETPAQMDDDASFDNGVEDTGDMENMTQSFKDFVSHRTDVKSSD